MNVSKNLYHIPILLNTVLEYLITDKNGIYLDGTLGGGGHSLGILENISNKGKLIGVDRDLDAISFASNKLRNFDNFIAIHNNFHNFIEILDELNINLLNGVLLDLGVSSHQIDSEIRGFSYHINSPLDMRMDTSSGITAKEYLNSVRKEDFTKILYDYGDEKWAKKIADNLIEFRNIKPLENTFDLVDIVDKSIPASVRYKIKGHPAKRTFQAIRIAINDEISPLEQTISSIINRLYKGGRLCIITFHSIEDRIVKNTFKRLQNPCTCPPKAPICTCNKNSLGKVITSKPILPNENELDINSRSHSAKLRVFERL